MYMTSNTTVAILLLTAKKQQQLMYNYLPLPLIRLTHNPLAKKKYVVQLIR
jgi:hypothetical protein